MPAVLPSFRSTRANEAEGHPDLSDGCGEVGKGTWPLPLALRQRYGGHSCQEQDACDYPPNRHEHATHRQRGQLPSGRRSSYPALAHRSIMPAPWFYGRTPHCRAVGLDRLCVGVRSRERPPLRRWLTRCARQALHLTARSVGGDRRSRLRRRRSRRSSWTAGSVAAPCSSRTLTALAPRCC